MVVDGLMTVRGGREIDGVGVQQMEMVVQGAYCTNMYLIVMPYPCLSLGHLLGPV